MSLIDRIFRRPEQRPAATGRDVLRRSFEAATGGRRGGPAAFPSFGDLNAEIAAGGARLRARSRHAAHNDPNIANGIGNIVAALWGTGIVPTAEPEAVAIWDAWCAVADMEARTDFNGIGEVLAWEMVTAGEVMLQVLETPDGLRVSVLPIDHLDSDSRDGLPGGGYIVSGVEFDRMGRRVAYHVHPRRPGLTTVYLAPVRVPAEQILHIFKPLGGGQVRGIPWTAPCLLAANEYAKYRDALLMGASVAAMMVGTISDTTANGGSESAFDDGTPSMEPGTVLRLKFGEEFHMHSPQQVAESGSFIRSSLQQIAAGLGVPEWMLSGDMTSVNYSSARAALIPFYRRVEATQYNAIVPQLLTPLWRRVVGDVPVQWLPPKPVQVDPAKDVQATVAEISAGLTSRAKAVAERGWSVAELDREIADDRAREASLGLAFGPSALGQKES
ncbi:MAG TPA: phage portal protein [Amaricoccus sp.]|uniref:phage portal protein n=1 Tax=Amaricoccus sp. TaxID=1872485 RepID=UPI002C029BD8|nr:phage portal protein [Amaricoccus sp.]HMQ91514.1 phage portal protein [Amaricoccus sp.]HMR50933.1 phage portal protein [Amaricoccus sp.]HMR58896.1 phage portal protein [Amaricoccus sp.]HMT97888.1 phage portal protein [Amaricoccus sp.]